MTGMRTTPLAERSAVGIAEVLEGVGLALAWKEETADRRRTKNSWAPDGDRSWVSSEDVAMRLGLWEVHEREAEWCSGCRAQTAKPYFYRSVPFGKVTAIGRKMGHLERQGLVERHDRYASLYRLTAEGEALLDDAREAALGVLNEVLT